MTLLLVVPLAIFYISDNRAAAEESFISEGNIIAHSLDASVKGKEDLEDHTTLLSIINKQIWLNPNILEINFNLGGENSLKTVASNNKDRINTTPDSDNVQSYKEDSTIHKRVTRGSEEVLRIMSPIHLSGRVVGTYQIDFSVEEIEQQISAKLKITYALLFISVGFIVFLFLLLNRIIIKPINKLKKGFHELTDNDFDARILIQSKDEFGELASNFNAMTNALKKSRDTIASYSKTLEKKVAERTKELGQKNIELEKFNNVAVGRELKMIELKKRIKELEKKQKNK